MTTTSGGTITFLGRSGRTYSYSVYVSDLGGVFWKFSSLGAAAATSSDFITLPEDVTVLDISLLATPTVSTISVMVKNDLSLSVVVQVSNCLYTNTTRSIPHVVIGAGKFQLMQI